MRMINILLLFLINCIIADGGSMTLISKKTVMGKGCPEMERRFIFEGERGLDRYKFNVAGHLRMLESSYELEYDGSESVKLIEYANEYYMIESGLGDYQSASIKIFCPSNKDTVYNSGKIDLSKSVCRTQEGRRLFYLDGIPKQNITEDGCSPKGF